MKILFRIMPLAVKAAPWYTLLNISMAVVHALTWTASIIATKNLFDAITLASQGQLDFWGCTIALLILAGVTFGQQIINGVHNFFAEAHAGKASGRLMTLFHSKLQRIDPACFEETDFLDDVNKAREGVNTAPYFTTVVLFIIFFYGVYFTSLGVYLFSLKPILLITLLMAFIPALAAQIVKAKVFTKLEEESAPLRRESEYYQRTLCDREYFKETRILGAFKFFRKLFGETLTLLTRKTWQAERKTALLELGLNTVSFAGMAVSSYLLFAAAMAGEISVGAFAAVFASLSTVFSIMQEIITMHIGNINKEIGKVNNFIKMYDLPELAGEHGTADFTQGITAENISFTYPGRDTPAVKGINLAIKDGETVAIVGENGAGKSTLVRLLTGIYRPTEGTVTVGGLDTSKKAPFSVFRRISGVFQKYQRYKMTLEENVSISDLSSPADKHKVSDALIRAGTGFDDSITGTTMLSPEFDGIDLSGGQWQRLAIARGLYRENGFIVLDEPTSAIDPIEETRIYTRFQELAQGKCAVVVTHRLGSARIAHRIIVMDAGEIVDSGTHDELIARPGKYADMWAAQAQWYERDNHSAFAHSLHCSMRLPSSPCSLS